MAVVVGAWKALGALRLHVTCMFITGERKAALSVAEPAGEGLEKVQDIAGSGPKHTEPGGAHR